MTSDPDRRRMFEALAEEVFEPLQRYLRRRAKPEDADDVLADVLLVLWRRLDDVPTESALAWSYGVARRTLANQRRGSERRLRLVEQLTTQAIVSTTPGLENPEEPEIQKALAALRPSDQEVLHLWAWEQLEPRDMAIVMGTTPNAVSLRLSRAKRRLAAELSRQDSSVAGHIEDKRHEEGHHT